MIRSLLISLLILMLSFPAFGDKKADTFIVTIYDGRVEVLSPDKIDKELSVIVENKTLERVLGKIINRSGKTHHFLRIPPNSSQSVLVKIDSTESLFFIPLSPASQEVELKVGAKAYSVPPAPTSR